VETREKIIDGCLTLFYKYGIKSITVDDISSHLGISKKTFYQYFANKNDVVKETVCEYIRRSKEINSLIIEEDSDVLDKLIKIYKEMLLQFHTYNPRFFYDVKKFNPDAQHLLMEFRDKQFDCIITKLIRQGKEEGWFRNEIDENIIFKLQLNRVAAIIEGSLLPEKKISDPIFLKFIIMDLVGITTIEGHKKLEEKLKELKNEDDF
jgi:TetR/AcrR family transcriptional regulator, cholesterol catabolism regulator